MASKRSAEVVSAVVLTHRGEEAGAALRALEAQTRAPDEIQPAGATRADWLWLLDGSVAPRPDALERLLEVIEDPGPLPAPVLLASKVVTPAGEPDPASLPVVETRDLDLAVAAAAFGLVAVRATRRGSLLVRADALDGEAGGLAWSARLLRTRFGLLVPKSVAIRHGAGSSAPVELPERLALLAGRALDPRERPWFAFRLLEDCLAAAKAARAGRRGPRG